MAIGEYCCRAFGATDSVAVTRLNPARLATGPERLEAAR